jgi:RNA polymerase sigma-70 factor, ECF subfamily
MSKTLEPEIADTPSALAVLALRPDPEAWEFLVHRHASAIYGLCLRICGAADLAEDACQECWLILRQAAGRFRAGTDEVQATAWIKRIAANCAFSLLKKRGRAAARDRRAGQIQQSPATDPALDFQDLHRALAELPERARLPLVLHYFSGLDYPDLAKNLGCSVNHARVKVHRGLNRLRARLIKTGICASAAATISALEQSSAAAAISVPATIGAHGCAVLTSSAVPLFSVSTILSGASLMKSILAIAAVCVLGGGAAVMSNVNAADTQAVAPIDGITALSTRIAELTEENQVLRKTLEETRKRNAELQHIAQVSRSMTHQLNVRLAEVEDDLHNKTVELAQLRQRTPEPGPVPTNQALVGIVAAVQINPEHQQDLVMLAIGRSDGVVEGMTFVISHDGKAIVDVRVQRVMDDIVECRVIPDTWSGDTNTIGVNDVATIKLGQPAPPALAKLGKHIERPFVVHQVATVGTDQDVLTLNLHSQKVEIGTEFIIYRGNQYIVKVRLESVDGAIATCRVIPETWNTNGEQIQAGDSAQERL